MNGFFCNPSSRLVSQNFSKSSVLRTGLFNVQFYTETAVLNGFVQF